jgi:transcriptional regulator with XRE-family HTH domain
MNSKRTPEESMFLKKLGDNIIRKRLENGVKAKDVYEKLDMDRSNYRRIEAGRTNPTVLLLRKISITLNIPVDQLLLMEEKSDNFPPK